MNQAGFWPKPTLLSINIRKQNANTVRNWWPSHCEMAGIPAVATKGNRGHHKLRIAGVYGLDISLIGVLQEHSSFSPSNTQLLGCG